MDRQIGIRIEVQAARALAEWKAFFAEQVAAKAKELANTSGQPDLVTIEHYRHAAALAARALLIDLEAVDLSDGHQEAA